MRQQIWLRTLFTICTLLLLAPTARAGYINWSGEGFTVSGANHTSFDLATGGTMSSGVVAGNTAVFPLDTNKPRVMGLWGHVPSDTNVTAQGGPALKCKAWGFTEAGQSGTVRLYVIGEALTPGTIVTGDLFDLGSMATIDVAVNGAIMAVGESGSWDVLVDRNATETAGGTWTYCAQDLTCLDYPLFVRIARDSRDANTDDTLQATFTLVAVACQYS